MKFMKFMKLCFLSVLFSLGCCFSAFAVREYFSVDDELVAVYEFMDNKDLLGTTLFIHAYPKDAIDDRMMMFAKYIRKRCQINQIDLRTLATRELIYSLDKNFDLIVEVNGRCKDFNIHKWALTILGVGEFKVCDEEIHEAKRLEERAVAPGYRTMDGQGEPNCLFMCWESRRLRDIIITDAHISASEYATPYSGGSDGWFRFTHQAANFCRNLVIKDKVYSYDAILERFRL